MRFTNPAHSANGKTMGRISLYFGIIESNKICFWHFPTFKEECKDVKRVVQEKQCSTVTKDKCSEVQDTECSIVDEEVCKTKSVTNEEEQCQVVTDKGKSW